MQRRTCASGRHNADRPRHSRHSPRKRDLHDTVHERLWVIQDKCPGRREQAPLSIWLDQQHSERGLVELSLPAFKNFALILETFARVRTS
jgi:hypothetical protein